MKEELERILNEIDTAARSVGKEGADICLVAVSKKQPYQKMLELQELLRKKDRIAVFGENYIQEFAAKRDFLEKPFEAHFIGRLQSNKAGQAVRLFGFIQSIDSGKTAAAVNKAATKIGKIQDVYLQVNISRDRNKGGFEPDGLIVFLKAEVSKFSHLRIKGLMTITRLYDDPEEARPDFRRMNELAGQIESSPDLSSAFDKHSVELSMGMSSDFRVAIEEGATAVRIGTAIFGSREGS